MIDKSANVVAYCCSVSFTLLNDFFLCPIFSTMTNSIGMRNTPKMVAMVWPDRRMERAKTGRPASSSEGRDRPRFSNGYPGTTLRQMKDIFDGVGGFLPAMYENF